MAIERRPMAKEYDLPPPQTHQQLESKVQAQVQAYLDSGGEISKIPILVRTAADVKKSYQKKFTKRSTL